jgi:hypothetical protein
MIFFPTWNHRSQNANHVICYGPKLLQFLCNATEQLMNIIHISTCTKGELDGEIRTAPYHVILMEESVLPVASSDTIFCRMAGSCLWLGLPPKTVSVALQCMCANVCGPYGATSSLVLVFTSLSFSMTLLYVKCSDVLAWWWEIRVSCIVPHLSFSHWFSFDFLFRVPALNVLSLPSLCFFPLLFRFLFPFSLSLAICFCVPLSSWGFLVFSF